MAVVTGSRAEFGLLAPVMRAVQAHEGLELITVVSGSHLLGARPTVEEVRGRFRVDAVVQMQVEGEARTRAADARAVGRGVSGFAEAFERLRPDWVVVLGDRIEAFAAASAASIGGWAVAHIHGGDRAEGIADEAMRHAITKMAHLHLAATEGSATRIVRMGERAEDVVVVGSPAVDGLGAMAPMGDEEAAGLGDPRCVILLHPSGLGDAGEREAALACAEEVGRVFGERGVLWLSPNHDAGREALAAVMREEVRRRGWAAAEHLERGRFVGLLKRLARNGGVLVGNSSAGLIEAAVVGVGVVNVGPRQAGRERADNVVDVERVSAGEVEEAVRRAMGLSGRAFAHPYGDGRAGERIAAELARRNPHDGGLLRKRNAF